MNQWNLKNSGAKMNLYHKFDNDVQEYKGDKISLGYSQKPHPIVLHCHHIDFPINSSFFMTSSFKCKGTFKSIPTRP